MPKSGKLITVFGGQFGSEGKGQIAAYLAQTMPVTLAVRVGGPNAGHTFYIRKGENSAAQKVVVQSIPVPAMLGSFGVIGPGGFILMDILQQELQAGYRLLGRPVQLMIDGNAAIISPEHMQSEQGLKGSIGSTGEGVGAATADKVMRRPDLVVKNRLDWMREQLPNDNPAYQGLHLGMPTPEYVNAGISHGATAMIEGTQGFGLSLHTSGFYPYCTSRECSPWALYAETGISPGNAASVRTIMVIRTFPIRVGGNSGPLAGEISWEALKERTDGYVTTPEQTTVTKKIRRIADLDLDLLHKAVQQCSPTELAVTFMDYQFPELANALHRSVLRPEHWRYLHRLEYELDVPISYISTGPGCTITLLQNGESLQ